MQKKMYCKTFAIGIIVFFIGAGVYSSSGITISEKPVMPIINDKTLFVGGSGEGNYTTIQDAINDSVDSDTVFVYNDSSPYYENIVVDKSINLIGEDRDTTIIDGSECSWKMSVSLSADWINISGFKIQNGNRGIRISSDYNNIIDNTISGRNYVIELRHSSNNTITDNTIISANDGGMFLWDSSNNTIIGNTFSDNWFGIGLDGGSGGSSNNTITGNTITSNYEEGIYLSDSSSNTITGNTISGNGFGIILGGHSTNTITGNTLSNNSIGIKVGYPSNYNIIYHNNFIDNANNAQDEFNNNNIWDDGKYGNYWSDYKEKYPDARKELFKPWMWDTPYEIPGEHFPKNKDNCPLIKQWPDTRPRNITRTTSSFSSFWLRFIDMFPILQRILDFIR